MLFVDTCQAVDIRYSSRCWETACRTSRMSSLVATILPSSSAFPYPPSVSPCSRQPVGTGRATLPPRGRTACTCRQSIQPDLNRQRFAIMNGNKTDRQSNMSDLHSESSALFLKFTTHFCLKMYSTPPLCAIGYKTINVIFQIFRTCTQRSNLNI